MRGCRLLIRALLLVVVCAALGAASLAQDARWKELIAQLHELNAEGNYAEGIPLAQEAVKLAEATFGVEHRNTALSLGFLGLMYQHHGEYEAAEAAMRHALAIDERALGPDDPEVAACLNNLADLYDDEGKYTDAELLFKRALSIDEKALGPDAPAIAPEVNNLAGVYDEEGKYDEAEQLYKRALAIVDKTLGPDSLEFAKSLNNLAGLYTEEARYAEAEKLYQRSMEIKLTAAEQPEDLATGLNNLAFLYVTEGYYAAAEPYYKQALGITEKALGPDHPAVAVGLNNLASLYQDQGRYAEAEPLFKRSLAIREKALGPNHPDVATALNNLASLYELQNRYAEAEPLYKRSLAIREETLGEDHPDVAASLNNLAQVYNDVGNNALAEALLKRSLGAVEKAVGPDHPDFAKALNNLGAVYKDEGKYADAEVHYKRALAIDEKTFGSDNLATATDLNNLALLYYAWNNAAQAEAFFERALNSLFRLFETSFSYMSEKDRLQFQDTVHFNIDIYFSFCLAHVREQPALAGKMYDVLLWEKGLVGSSIATLRSQVSASGDGEAVKIFDQLATKKGQSARLASARPEGWQQSRKKIDDEANDLEQQLARRVSRFDKSGAQSRTTWRDVQNKLQPHQAAIEFVRFPYHDGKQWTEKSDYAALVVTLDSRDAPAFFALGDAKVLEADPLTNYRASVGLHKQTVMRGVEAEEEEQQQQQPATASETTFYAAFWKPLEPSLSGAERIYLSPDGVLNQVALGDVAADDGKLLLEKYDLRVVSSTRDLCRDQRKYSSRSAVLIGNPSFDLSEAQQRAAMNALHNGRAAALEATAETHGPQFRDFTGAKLKPLPGTQEELQAVSSIFDKQHWSVQMFTQQSALKDALLAVNAPQVLHLATHGFFDADQSKRPTNRSSEQPASDEDPMLRSGLFFAGANRRLSGQAVAPDLDDGVLTSYEASLLNLQGTELVVLSACDTGLGVVAAGEGVFGLRRAFQVAGAQSVLMSMWSVPDQETQELMALFYQKWLSGEDKHQALRDAQLAMRERVKARYEKDLPQYWGAFVLVGP